MDKPGRALRARPQLITRTGVLRVPCPGLALRGGEGLAPCHRKGPALDPEAIVHGL